MRRLLSLFACVCLAGCATFRAGPASFDNAVRSSLEKTGESTCAVVRVHNDGSLTIAGRQTTLAELATLRSVKGLPNDEPAVLIEATPTCKHAYIRQVMDMLSKNGIWRLKYRHIKTTEQSQNQQIQPIAGKSGSG